MNAEMHPIGIEELVRLIEGTVGAQALVEASVLADPLLVAYYGKELIGFVGFVPASTLSDSAYAWVHTTEAANKHPLAVARLARRWMTTFHYRYPKLFGHCTGNPRSVAWLKSLGAQFGSIEQGLIKFTIEANHG